MTLQLSCLDMLKMAELQIVSCIDPSQHMEELPRSPTYVEVNATHNSLAKFNIFFYSLLLLLLSHFGRVQLCATPEMAAHQAPPSLGLSRQEHWSGLHASEQPVPKGAMRS